MPSSHNSSVPDIPGLPLSSDEENYLRGEVSRLLDRRDRRSFPGAQPVSMTYAHIANNLMKEDYYVCEKTDGTRALLYLKVDKATGATRTYLINRSNEYFLIEGLNFPGPPGPRMTVHKDCLIDGELVLDTLEGGKQVLRYLVFDALAVDENNLTKKPLDRRLGYYRSYLHTPYEEFLKQNPQIIQQLPFTLSLKKMQLGYALQYMFDEVIPNLRHGNDGLIFTCRASQYIFGSDEKILKWKPADENSIDFQVELEFQTYNGEQDDGLGQHNGDSNSKTESYIDYDSKPIFHLNVWQGGSMYEPFAEMTIEDDEWEKLKALDEPLQERIVEVYQDTEGKWRFMRFRDDKANGNHVSVLNKVLASIRDGVTKEQLLLACPKIREAWKARERATASESSEIHKQKQPPPQSDETSSTAQPPPTKRPRESE